MTGERSHERTSLAHDGPRLLRRIAACMFVVMLLTPLALLGGRWSLLALLTPVAAALAFRWALALRSATRR